MEENQPRTSRRSREAALLAEFTNCSEGIPQQPLTMNFPPLPVCVVILM